MSHSNENKAHPSASELLAANRQWAADVKKGDEHFFERSKEGQYPRVLWLGCSDSRVPESVITAAKPGEIFVHRTIANLFHPKDISFLSVITYAVNVVKVNEIVVVGHTECGGVKTCLAAHAEDAKVAVPSLPADAPLNQWLAPLLAIAKSLPPKDPSADHALKLTEASVKAQVENVIGTEIVRNAWAEGRKVSVHGWVYVIGTGELKDLGITRDRA